jgi:hypothetical protein
MDVAAGRHSLYAGSMAIPAASRAPGMLNVELVLLCYFMDFELVYLREWITWHLALGNVTIYFFPTRDILVDVRNLTRLQERDVALIRVLEQKARGAVQDDRNERAHERVHVMCRRAADSFLPEPCGRLTDPWLFVGRAEQAKAIFLHHRYRHWGSWMLRIDLDEFLEVDEMALPDSTKDSTHGPNPPLARTLHKFNLLGAESVIINWRVYGPNGVDNNPTHEVVRRFPRPAAAGCQVNRQTKQLVRLMGNRSTFFNWHARLSIPSP